MHVDFRVHLARYENRSWNVPWLVRHAEMMTTSEWAMELLTARYGLGPESEVVSVPGRVNLIGEHIDYHDLPVLPIAIQRHVSIAFKGRPDRQVSAVSSAESAPRRFELSAHLGAGPAGDWANYLKAAVMAVQTRWRIARGLDAAIASDLPVAAGLSSSSALLAGFALALLKVNGIVPTIDELMSVLPEGEHFVGTRGGGMDHAAVTAARRGCALLVGFAPLTLRHITIPPGWRFIVAHSLTRAEKSGAVREKYNRLREEGLRELGEMNLPSFRFAVNAAEARDQEGLVFRHVVNEARRVCEAVTALGKNDIREFGSLLLASHASLRDNLGVSTPAIDALVEAAMQAGAAGARLTGAGFGGCVVVLAAAETSAEVHARLTGHYYSKLSDFQPHEHLFEVEPSDGALAM